MICWISFEILALIIFVPETYVPVILKRKAARLRRETGNPKYYAPIERTQRGIFRAILISCYVPFKILAFERMALLLDLWTSLVLGVLYLTFQAFPIIFGEVHGFSTELTGLSFLGLGVGMAIALATQPLWTRLHYKKIKEYNGNPPPETRLYIGMVGAILFPLGLFWLAFTTYSQVHWIVPIIASVPFGVGIIYIFTAVFTFLVTAYRPYAASAMAGNSFLRSAFAAAFPLFSDPMYVRLGTVGATALLGGLALLMSPLPFVFYRIGARIREKSQFTT